MLTSDDILQELEVEADPTRRTLERVPEDKLDWRPHEKSFPLGQLAMHVATIPRALFIRRVMLNHWYHHRGQLTVYLRQTGALLPAIYGPSADEMPVFE